METHRKRMLVTCRRSGEPCRERSPRGNRCARLDTRPYHTIPPRRGKKIETQALEKHTTVIQTVFSITDIYLASLARPQTILYGLVV